MKQRPVYTPSRAHLITVLVCDILVALFCGAVILHVFFANWN